MRSWRDIVAQAFTLAFSNIVCRQDARGVGVVVRTDGHAAASQTAMLNQLLQFQLDLGAVQASGRDIALHEGAIEAPGDPRVRVDGVFDAGDLLPGVVAVSVGDGVHVVAQGVHDISLGGTDAHDSAASAVQAPV